MSALLKGCAPLILMFAAFAAMVGKASGLDDPRSVVVYYANETTEAAARSPNYAALLAMLRRSANPATVQVADLLVRDAAEFPAAVRSHVETLIEAARRREFDLFVFTNSLALGRHYLVYRASTGRIETRIVPELPDAESAVLATSPLARPDYLRAALLEVAGAYPGGSVKATLITNSHGTGELALTPRVFADLTTVDAGHALADIDASTTAGRPSWAADQGTTKSDYWRVIGEVGAAAGMAFDLVFRHSCQSGVSTWKELALVPNNVRTIAHTWKSDIAYRDIDFAALLPEQSGSTVADDLAGGLQSRGIHIGSKGGLWRFVLWDEIVRLPHFLFFVPLALWCGWHLGTGRIVLRRRPA